MGTLMLDTNGKLNKVPTLTRLAYIARYYIGGAVVSICRHLFDYSVAHLGAKLSLKKHSYFYIPTIFTRYFLNFSINTIRMISFSVLEAAH